jgi:putative ABC transport system permease protein
MESMGPQEISTLALVICFFMLLVPLVLSLVFKLQIIRSMFMAIIRMAIQLFLMALFLKYLFQWNNPWINIAWLIVMVIVATFSVVKSSNLNWRFFLLPVFLSLLISVFCVILFFNSTILRLPFVLDAKYFIVIGGMLLGNSLRGNIIGMSTFFKDLKRNEERYLYHLSLGASKREATMPYLRNSLTSALKPTIASMATIGIVFIPGMMTGQILGGSTPMTAIKYQIAIMVAIFVILSIAMTLTLMLTLKMSFNEYGILNKGIMK